MNTIEELFEAELRRRGIAFEIDSDSGRYAIENSYGRYLVSLANLARDLGRDGDEGRVSRFVDTIEGVASPLAAAYAVENLYWALEPNDYEEKADFREAVSDRVDRVLVHLSSDIRRITWASPGILEKLGVSEAQAGVLAFENLASALAESTVEYSEIDGVRLGMINTSLPCKSSLILAPNLHEVAGAALGWPVLAVAPDRDFLYLWDSRHTDFTGRVGEVVVREFTESSYPISPEVFKISDDGIEAIGEFPV